MEKDSKVVVFAEFVTLKEEVEKLRTEFSMFLYDRDYNLYGVIMKFLDELEKVLRFEERFIGEDNQIIKTKVLDVARGLVS